MKNPKIILVNKVALSVVIFSIIIIFCYGSMLFWKVGFSLNRMVAYLNYDWEDLKIDAGEIPVYPNAQDIIIDTPPREVVRNTVIVGTWKFTTNDETETVWKYYVDEMGRRWGFYEWPLLPEYPMRLTIMSCPAYDLTMTSKLIEHATHSITIQFSYFLCM